MWIPFRFTSNPNFIQISMKLSKNSYHVGKRLNPLRPWAKKRSYICLLLFYINISTNVFLRDHNGNKVTQFFVLSLTSHHMENFFTTIFNFNEFILVCVVNIRFICNDEIYLLKQTCSF